MKSIVLASVSPRRRELLQMIVPKFAIVPSLFEEKIEQGVPEEIVMAQAKGKAREVAARYPRALVLGADTLVFLDQLPLGKPKDAAEAAEMLRSLSGREHTVITGVSAIWKTDEYCFCETTQVRFAKMTENEIREYIAKGDPMDKAGAYGIQGMASRYIEGIEGCYFNVMGLPVHRVYELLKELNAF